MKAEQVDQALCQKFVIEDERLVFRNDVHGEFTDYVSRGLPSDLAGVKILKVAQYGGLSTKLLLEREDPNSKFLIYSVGELPPAAEDWLLDIWLCSAEFHVDVASIWLQELPESCPRISSESGARFWGRNAMGAGVERSEQGNTD